MNLRAFLENLSVAGYRFLYPEALLLLLILPVLWWIRRAAKGKEARLQLASTAAFRKVRPSLRMRVNKALPVLQTLALGAMIFALARPQEHHVSEYIESEGIDIVLAMDVSGSMLAEDLKPNRLEAAKKVAEDFVNRRQGDRIGLVIFSGESFTQTPATMDHRVVLEHLNMLRAGGMLQDGTAIGDGLATAVDRVRDGAKSRIVVLMTDGISNMGHVSPGTALEIAKAYGVRVYTIGIGTTGQALTTVRTPFGIDKVPQEVQIDEPLLKQIAGGTGGKYFRATDNASLKAIYNDIDALEKQKIETTTEEHTRELAWPLLLTALALLAVAQLVRIGWMRSVRE